MSEQNEILNREWPILERTPKHNAARDAELDRIRLERLDKIIELEAQRDELLAACKELITLMGPRSGAWRESELDDLTEVRRARAAIASAERGQQ
jgi:hypothetical protein